jgi:hypothetical protein
MCAASISQRLTSLADKKYLNNVAVPNPCTVIAHPYSSAVSEVFSSNSSSSEKKP